MLLSKRFSRPPDPGADDATILAHLLERGQRELLWRAHVEREDADALQNLKQVTLAETVMARDAGDVCHVCGDLVTWVDHLPPLDPGGAVRCFTNVRALHTDVEIDDIARRV